MTETPKRPSHLRLVPRREKRPPVTVLVLVFLAVSLAVLVAHAALLIARCVP